MSAPNNLKWEHFSLGLRLPRARWPAAGKPLWRGRARVARTSRFPRFVWALQPNLSHQLASLLSIVRLLTVQKARLVHFLGQKRFFMMPAKDGSGAVHLWSRSRDKLHRFRCLNKQL